MAAGLATAGAGGILSYLQLAPTDSTQSVSDAEPVGAESASTVDLSQTEATSRLRIVQVLEAPTTTVSGELRPRPTVPLPATTVPPRSVRSVQSQSSVAGTATTRATP